MFVGNEKAKNLIESLQGKEFPHLLIVGPRGHGKTTLARMVSEDLQEVSSTSLEDHDDLLAVLKSKKIIFIDEIHSLKRKLQEALYEAMESRIFQRISGRGEHKYVETIKLPNFTLIATTTKEHKLNAPLKNRFLTVHIQGYNEEELVQIAKQIVPENVAKILAKHSRYTPRTLLKLCQMYNTLQKDPYELLHDLDIQKEGLTSTEVRILNILKDGTHSLPQLAAKLQLDEELVMEEHETFLIQKDYISISKVGREITKKGREYLFPIKVYEASPTSY